MKRRTLLTLAFLALLVSASLGPAQIGAQTGSQSATTAPVTIPFELVSRHIMVKARINNSRPLSFVFDTGDKVGIVDTNVAKELGLKLEGQVRIGGAGADTLPGSYVREATWSLPGSCARSPALTRSRRATSSNSPRPWPAPARRC